VCTGQSNMSPLGEVIDAFGNALRATDGSVVDASAYLHKGFSPAHITVNNQKYLNQNVRLNLATNTVSFETNGVEKVPKGVVNRIEFIDLVKNQNTVFRNGFPEINKNTTQTYYQVLDSGKNILLLKHIGLTLKETRQYGSSSTQKGYQQVKTFYVFSQNKLEQIKKIDVLLDAMKDKRPEIETFISTNKIKAAKEDDLKRLIAYYNKL
jgi:hypothetical protein